MPVGALVAIDEDTLGKVATIASARKLVITEGRSHLSNIRDKVGTDGILGHEERLFDLGTQCIVLLDQHIVVADIGKGLDE